MNEYSMTRFFNQFIKVLKTNINNIEIITDKDGTILINEELKQILEEIKTKQTKIQLHITANTGRTIADMIEALKKEKIPLEYFDYIIGDNGANCLDVRHKKELFKNTINFENANKAIEKFLALGGSIGNLRLTDGEHIYAYDSPEVRKYYDGNEKVIFKTNFEDLENIDITKLTFTGTHYQIMKIKEYIQNNIPNSKTHAGKTFFPEKENNNYRLDFTRKSYKGNSIKIR